MGSLKDKTLTIEPTVGYMLKVIKSGQAITKYNDEFKAIRHGNYYDFLTLVKGPIPFMVSYTNGVIRTEESPEKDDCDFAGLLKVEPSLVIFYRKCFSEYGPITDMDISDEVFGKVVLFELSLRMHSNNNTLLNDREQLVHVIDKLCNFKNLSVNDTAKLHLGRQFLNMIKHPKSQFPSWNEGLKAFEFAYQVLIINKLTIL